MDIPLEKARYTDDSDTKLKLNWANEDQSTDSNKKLFENNSHVLLQVNIEKAFANMDSDTEDDLYFKAGRCSEDSEKVQQATSNFLNKELVDFPSIASNKEYDSVDMTSGKEVAMAAYDIGCKFIPMLVSKKDLTHFSSIVETKDMTERLDSVEVESKKNVSSPKKNRFC